MSTKLQPFLSCRGPGRGGARAPGREAGVRATPAAYALTLLALAVGCGPAAPPPKPAASAATPQAAPPPPPPPDVKVKGEERLAKVMPAIAASAEQGALDPAETEKAMQAVLAVDPKNLIALYNLAVLREAQHKTAEASKLYEQALAVDPAFKPAALNLARINVQQDNLKAAVALYREFIKNDPREVEARMALGQMLFRIGRHQEAIDVCRQVLQRKGDEIEAFRILAESYYLLGNYPLAELIAARGLKARKNDERLTFLLGKMLLVKKNIPGAVRKFREAIEFNPQWIQARQEVGAISLSYRDFANAAEQFQAVVDIDHDNIPALLGLGIAYKGLGRYDAAEKAYQRILALKPDLPEVQWNLAILYHRDMNKYEQALTAYERFKASAPKEHANLKEIDKTIETVKQTIVTLQKMAERQRAQEALAKQAEAELPAIEAQVAAKSFAGAAAKLQPFMDNLPQDVALANRLRMAMANALIGQGKFADAQPHVMMVVGMDPENKAALQLFELLQQKLGASEEPEGGEQAAPPAATGEAAGQEAGAAPAGGGPPTDSPSP